MEETDDEETEETDDKDLAAESLSPMPSFAYGKLSPALNSLCDDDDGDFCESEISSDELQVLIIFLKPHRSSCEN